jgi:branched-chain amino acid transport system permease protein
MSRALPHPRNPAWIAVLAAVVLLPFVVRHAIATEIWIFAIFGLGLNLLLGYTGLLSFGQATFFGSAAYVGGYLLKHHGTNVLLVLAIGVLVGAITAALVGYLCVQRSELYFIMLTFALNQMFYFTAYQWTTVTGGEDGMPGVPRPAFLGLDLGKPLVYYVFVAVFFLGSLWVMKRIVDSPLGTILQAIRENPLRAEAVGYDARRFKLLAFVVSGAFSGLAGVFYAMLFGIVPLEAIGFVFSGNVVFATLIGGSGSLYGPVIGAFVFIWLSESVSVIWQRWPLLLGVAFVIVVLFFRGGVVEAWSRLASWWAGRRPARPVAGKSDAVTGGSDGAA